MAKYTVELGTLVKNNFDLGLEDYPIYKEEYRKHLNDLIIEHFYFREIGLETPELFKRFLNRKMMEIMPYYNQLYKSEDVKYNPLYNVELFETFEQQGKTNSNSSGNTNTTRVATNENDSTNNVDRTITNNGTNESINVEDSTPNSEITLEDIRNNKYASKAEINTDTASNTEIDNDDTVSHSLTTDNITDNSSNSIANSENSNTSYTKSTVGSSAGFSFSEAIRQWRKNMINVNMQIIEELDSLFMQIF